MPAQPAASRGRAWRAFTLIELLVVVAIISILASIAVPNFLEAQTRAKVASMKAAMHAMTVAIESYRVDNQNYPYRRNTHATSVTHPEVPELGNRLQEMSVLTTPVAYITTLPTDIFEMFVDPPNNIIDYYDPTQTSWMINWGWLSFYNHFVTPATAGWILVSVGPDGYLGPYSLTYGWPFNKDARATFPIAYDPTNGTISSGNIFAGQMGGIDETGAMITRLVH